MVPSKVCQDGLCLLNGTKNFTEVELHAENLQPHESIRWSQHINFAKKLYRCKCWCDGAKDAVALLLEHDSLAVVAFDT